MRLPIASYGLPGRSSGRLVNVYPQQSVGKTPVELIGCPGIVTVQSFTGPGRGLFVMEGTVYAVAGTTVYTLAGTTVGTLPGSEVLTFATNDLEETVFSNNYILTGGTIAAIADADAPTFSSVDYVDGYIVAAEEGTDRFYCSALRDATSWGALDYSGTIASSDNLVRLIVDHNQVILFGESSVEIFWLSGASGFPFERTANGTLEIGAVAKLGVCKADNSVFWLASDRTLRRLSGSTPVRVSQHGFEEAVAGYATISDVQMFTIPWEGHIWVCIRFPTEDKTWVYDCTTGEMFERESYHRLAWDVVSSVTLDGRVYVQSQDGSVGYLDSATYTEFGEAFRREVTFPNLYSGNARQFFSQIDFVMRTGDAPIGVTPYLTCEVSDDGGQTFHTLPLRELGLAGQYRKVVRWNRLGSARDRVFRISTADNAAFHLLAAELAGESGAI